MERGAEEQLSVRRTVSEALRRPSKSPSQFSGASSGSDDAKTPPPPAFCEPTTDPVVKKFTGPRGDPTGLESPPPPADLPSPLPYFLFESDPIKCSALEMYEPRV